MTKARDLANLLSASGTLDYSQIANTPDLSLKADVTSVNSSLALKANTSSLATVATSGDFTDLSNQPTPFDPNTLAAVATSGDYNDIATNKPTIPSAVSDLSNDTGFITSSSVPTAVSELTNDSGYLTTAPAPTTSQVLSATAGLTAGAVGTYAFMGALSSSVTGFDQKDFGETFAGSGLKGRTASGYEDNGTAKSGTWRCLGYKASFGSDLPNSTTLWVRIS